MGFAALLRARRTQNATRFLKLNRVLLCLFPVLLVLISEYNQLQSFDAMKDFFAKRPGVFLFDCFFVGTLYGMLLFTLRRGWVAALASGLLFFILSCVEFFKFDVSGSHFIPQDLALTGKFNTVASMARLRVTLPIIAAFLLLAAAIFLLWLMGAIVKAPTGRRFLLGGTCLLLILMTLVSPLSSTVFAAFDVDTRTAGNKFLAAAKFENNNMVAFWASELSHALTARPPVPDHYGKELVLSALAKANAGGRQPKVRPNVVFILSESFADFRRLSDKGISDGPYNALDRMQKEGTAGTTVVPTFGGYTIRSEFELLHGLPVASLADPVFPHKEVTTEDPGAFPSLYRALGYSTTYIHPFAADFYERSTLYPHLGFDTLLFEEDLPVDENRFHAYADDGLLYDTALATLEKSDEPAFVFATSMQNHQPFYGEGDVVTADSEFAFYLKGLTHSSDRLNDFLDELHDFEEPTLVFFVGDHYPFLGQNGSIYDALGLDETNCQILFEQPYAVWANYKADLTAFPETTVSLFYLPHLMLETAAPDHTDRFSHTMLSLLDGAPLYTTPYQPVQEPNALLDLLTYDRICGGGFSLD